MKKYLYAVNDYYDNENHWVLFSRFWQAKWYAWRIKSKEIIMVEREKL